ncbi:MAG TPA: redoxin domain-containing protein [Thermodesulfovibrionales bacterium]|nr:redoxin domain-containing protein [Thermodesulfovibrionales bacterium]
MSKGNLVGATRRSISRLLPFFIGVFVFVSFLSLSAFPTMANALLQVGAQAPAFTLKDVEGKEVSLSSFSQKKAVIVVFWSTWSANSPRALKRFEEFHLKYKDRGMQVVGINADNQTISAEDLENIRKQVKDTGITFPVLLDRGLKTFHDYNVIALPSTLVVSEGKITYELPGLPLVGTEDMFDYLLVLAGEAPKKKMEDKYRPRRDVVADTSLGRNFAAQKKYDQAYPLFQKAIEKDPKYLLPYIELAKLYELEGKNAEAEDILRKALAVEQQNVVAMSELGYLLSRRGKTSEALEILDKAVKMNSYPPAHFYYAYALSKDGKLNEAMKAFGEAIALNPFEPSTYLLRGEVYENNKMFKEASADYRKALELILKIKE